MSELLVSIRTVPQFLSDKPLDDRIPSSMDEEKEVTSPLPPLLPSFSRFYTQTEFDRGLSDSPQSLILTNGCRGPYAPDLTAQNKSSDTLTELVTQSIPAEPNLLAQKYILLGSIDSTTSHAVTVQSHSPIHIKVIIQ